MTWHLVSPVRCEKTTKRGRKCENNATFVLSNATFVLSLSVNWYMFLCTYHAHRDPYWPYWPGYQFDRIEVVK